VLVNPKEDVLEYIPELQDRVQVGDMMASRHYKYLSNGKRTLLMFRKLDKSQLELRHQRTSDVLFDLVDEQCSLSAEAKEYVY
jgi:hypothetical protein